MTKVNKIQVVMTLEENAELIKEAAGQQRTISNLARKYINEGVKRDINSRKQILPPFVMPT